MLEQIFYNEMTYWLLGTAIVFTFVGRAMSFRDAVEDVVGSTIDSLIEQGYLKTSGTGKNLEIIKHEDWCNDQDSR